MTQAEHRNQLIVRERRTNFMQGAIMAPVIVLAPVLAIYIIGMIFG